MPRTITRGTPSWRAPHRTRGAPASPGDLGEDLLGDVEVRRHALHVVELLEHLDESEGLASPVLVDGDLLLGDHRALGRVDLNPGLGEGGANPLEIARGRLDLDPLGVRGI